ncbi:MAG: hypothetical protein PVI99_07360 [Anaerolineales bacterium]|jgi:hypothetical protein
MENLFGNKDILWICLIGLFAIGVMIFITPFGVGVDPDSLSYMEAADNLDMGKGYVVHGDSLPYYPPLYSIFLIGTKFFTDDMVQGVRFLNALVFGLNVITFGIAVYFTVDGNIRFVGLVMFVIMISAPLIILHSMIYSEPLFILFTLSALLTLSFFVDQPSKTLFVLSVVFLVLAIFTRYVGIALIPAAVLSVLVLGSNRHLIRRIRDALALLLLVSLPVGILFARNMFVAGTAANLKTVYHPISWSHIQRVIFTLNGFFLPIRITFWLRALLFFLMMAFLILGLGYNFTHGRKTSKSQSLSMQISTTSFFLLLTYLIFLFVSISLFNAHTPIDTRLLSPVFIFLIISASGIASNLSKITDKNLVWLSWVFVIGLTILINFYPTITKAIEIKRIGLGYTSRNWRDSDSISYVRQLEEDKKIYTNGADAIKFLSGKLSFSIPRTLYPGTMEENEQFDHEMKTMCTEIKQGEAILILFDSIAWRWYFPNQEKIEATCKVPILQRFSDGTVYGE